ncbi:hypothetical protein TcasGA2_TC035027, partial [Tribolium castaneum]
RKKRNIATSSLYEFT